MNVFGSCYKNICVSLNNDTLTRLDKFAWGGGNLFAVSHRCDMSPIYRCRCIWSKGGRLCFVKAKETLRGLSLSVNETLSVAVKAI